MSDPAADTHLHPQPLRLVVGLLLVAGVAVVFIPVRTASAASKPGLPLSLFLCAVAGAVYTAFSYVRGRPWARAGVLLGMIGVQAAAMAGIACLNNMKYLADSVEPLAGHYLFGNLLRLGSWFGMPTRNLAVCLIGLIAAVGLLLVFPVMAVMRDCKRSPRASWAWLWDLRFVIVASTLIWNVAMVGLTLRPFTLGYLW